MNKKHDFKNESLQQEVDWFMEELGYTFKQTLEEIDSRFDERLYGAKDGRKELRLYLISIGVYREISEDEINRTLVLGGSAWDFSINKKKYVFETWDI